jgi:hypothetical protein
MSFLQGPPAGGDGVAPGSLPDDVEWAGQYPALWEYMTAGQFPDGKARQTSTVLLLIEDGVWKACLNDRALARSAWASGDTLERVLVRLEAMLATGAAEWRRRPTSFQRKK